MAKKRKRSKGASHGLQTFTLCVSTTMVLVLLGLVVFSVFTARNLSTYVKENFIVTMMLEDDMTKAESQQLISNLKKKDYVGTLTFISKEQALKEQTEAMGSDPTEFIGANPFLASVEFTLKSDYANGESLKWISKELKKFPKISDITYQKDLIDSVNTNLHRVSLVLLALAVLLMFVSFSLISNTVRLGIYSRRFTIHTMKLVGASWGFIRRPFLFQGILIGLSASFFADLVLAAIIYALYTYQPEILSVVTPEVMIVTGLSVFLLGIIITFFCTLISVNKFLRMKTGDLYKV